MLCVAHRGAASPVTARDAARAAGVSEPTARGYLRRLARAGLLRRQRRRPAAYRLAKPAESITLLDLVEAMSGPVRSTARAPRAFDAGVTEELIKLLDDVTAAARDQLDSTTLADLAAQAELADESHWAPWMEGWPLSPYPLSLGVWAASLLPQLPV